MPSRARRVESLRVDGPLAGRLYAEPDEALGEGAGKVRHG